jgi:hypothetical protein
MKRFAFAVLVGSMFLSGFTVVGCQTEHSETDKPNLLGGHTHEETTTTKNPVTGDVSTSHTQQKTSN